MKKILKQIIDIIMILAFIFLPGYTITGGFLHELAGVILFVFLILHTTINFNWYKSLFKGKYNLNRTIRMIINNILILSVIITILTGVLISDELFNLKLSVNYYVYNLHKCFAYYSLIFACIHGGMHIDYLISKIKKPYKNIILTIMFLLILVMIYTFMDLKIYEYIIFIGGFRFYQATPATFYFKILLLSLGFLSIGEFISIVLKKHKNKSDNIITN